MRVIMRTDQPNKCFYPPQKHITDRSKAVALLWFSVASFWCQSFGDVSPYVCSYFLVGFGLLSGHLLINSCSFG